MKKAGVEVAYLFGSVARNDASPISDIDIGVLFSESLSPRQKHLNALALISDLIGIYHKNNVEVVDLQQASPALRYNAINQGKVIFNIKETRRTQFEVHALNSYLSTKPLRDQYNQQLIQEVRKGLFYDR